METWGRRGFAAAVITGGMLGLSGASGEAAPAYRNGATRLADPRQPQPPPAASTGLSRGTTHYGPPEPGPVEYRGVTASEQTMTTPTCSEQSSARHAALGYAHPAGPGLDSPSSGLTDPPRADASDASPGADSLAGPLNEGTTGVGVNPAGSGSDGFLAGNLAALPAPPASPLAGTPVGALDAAEASLGTRFASYGTPSTNYDTNYGLDYGADYGADYGREYGRTESRHARPEPAEQQYTGWFSEQSAEPSRTAESYGGMSAERHGGPEGHTALVPQVAPGSGYLGEPTSYPAEQPVRSPELVGVSYAGAARHTGPASGLLSDHVGYPHSQQSRQQGQHCQPGDSDTSALGSLDSSGLFGALSQPPR